MLITYGFFSFYQNLSTRILVTPCKMQHTRTNVDMQNIYAKMHHNYESTHNENKNFDLIVNFTIYYKHSNIKKITCPINLFWQVVTGVWYFFICQLLKIIMLRSAVGFIHYTIFTPIQQSLILIQFWKLTKVHFIMISLEDTCEWIKSPSLRFCVFLSKWYAKKLLFNS